jgi:hypothetical protein
MMVRKTIVVRGEMVSIRDSYESVIDRGEYL